MNPYENCPILESKNFIYRLIQQDDSESLFECYHDKKAVNFMNDDNCDFGFYMNTLEDMKNTIHYWINFYKQGAFIRFAVIDKKENKTIGTIEGFGGEIGVVRLDISLQYEKEVFLAEMLDIVQTSFFEIFGNQRLLTKAKSEDKERISALLNRGSIYVGEFRGFDSYYEILKL